jgi:hypothetical protein
MVQVIPLLRIQAVIRHLVRATSRTAEVGVGEDAVVVITTADHAETGENESDLRNHEADGGEVQVAVVATVAAAAAARLLRQMEVKVEGSKTKLSNWTVILIRMKQKQRILLF